MTRRPINSAAEPHGRTAAGSLDQNNSVATNGPEIGARATASAPDSTSQVSNRLAVLVELSLADLRLEWRQLFRADPPRLSRDIMMRAIAYRLQEFAHGGASKVTQRRLMTLAAEFETGGMIAPFSLGLPAVFQFGGLKRTDPVAKYALRHGDVAVWGGPSRLRYHGVAALKDGRHPKLGRMRINLTLRRAL